MSELTLHTNQLKQSTCLFSQKGKWALEGKVCSEREQIRQLRSSIDFSGSDILPPNTSFGSERINSTGNSPWSKQWLFKSFSPHQGQEIRNYALPGKKAWLAVSSFFQNSGFLTQKNGVFRWFLPLGLSDSKTLCCSKRCLKLENYDD